MLKKLRRIYVLAEVNYKQVLKNLTIMDELETNFEKKGLKRFNQKNLNLRKKFPKIMKYLLIKIV